MNNISNLISDKAQNLSMTPMTNTTLKMVEEKPIQEAVTPTSPPQVEIENPTNPEPEKTPQTEPELNTPQLKSMIYSIKDQLDAMLRVIEGKEVNIKQSLHPKSEILTTGEKIIEGVFNGEKMVGEDGKEYEVAPNYASKSKMVEGDLLKLTVTNNGRYIYKQIGPIERKRITGELVADPSGTQWSVLAEGKTYKVLTASITFYKAKAGDEVTILVPEDGMSAWGAVDNIVSK